MASDEKTARAIFLVSRWCSDSALDRGRPTSSRFRAWYTGAILPPAGRACGSGLRYHPSAEPEPGRRGWVGAAGEGEVRAGVHVVVVGCGRVGSELAGTLEKDG